MGGDLLPDAAQKPARRERMVRAQPLHARRKQRPVDPSGIVDVQPARVRDRVEHEMIRGVDRRDDIQIPAAAAPEVREVHIVSEIAVDADLRQAPRWADALEELHLSARKRFASCPNPIHYVLDLKEPVPSAAPADAGPDLVVDQRAAGSFVLSVDVYERAKPAEQSSWAKRPARAGEDLTVPDLRHVAAVRAESLAEVLVVRPEIEVLGIVIPRHLTGARLQGVARPRRVDVGLIGRRG